MVVSSVSPERCEMIVSYPLRAASSTASNVSDSVPIWFGLIRMLLAASVSIPSRSRSTLVTNRSSPQISVRSPTRSVSSANPS